MLKQKTIMIERKVGLSGYVTGYEILEKGIVVRSHTFKQPVKNLVTDAGKDGYCTAFGLTSSNANTSPLNFGTKYMGRGTGSSATTAGMTALQAEIGNRTNSLVTGDPYTGVRYQRSTGTIYLRKTYTAEVEASPHSIGEVAFFNASAAGTMFSRVVFPLPIYVSTGQQLRVTYELVVTLSPINPIASTSPTINGWTTIGTSFLKMALPADSATYAGLPNSAIGVWNQLGNDSVTATNGNNEAEPCACGRNNSNSFATWANTTGSFAAYMPASLITFGVATGTPGNNNVPGSYYDYSGPGGAVFPINGETPGSTSPGTQSNTVLAYTPGTFYRDREVVWEADCPGVVVAVRSLLSGAFVHVFDSAQSKTTLQRLRLVFRTTLT